MTVNSSSTRVPELIGSSEPMEKLRREIARFAATRIPILINGPTGSGKELVAAAIHRQSNRSGNLVALNVCAVPDTMFEDTLFGHARGAFTGADKESAGMMAEANGGTLFLDEISGLNLMSQAKLLRAIETGTFRPVGAARDRISDFRVISATNENLTHLAQSGRFRIDLLHRLGGMVVHVPPLRARLEDLPALSAAFLEYMGASTVLTEGAIHVLASHPWPGNVRELRHTVERAIVMAQGGRITSDVARAALRVVGDGLADLSNGRGDEARAFVEILDRLDWDTAEVARELGVHRATIYRRMERLGIVAERGTRHVGDFALSTTELSASARTAKKSGSEKLTGPCRA